MTDKMEDSKDQEEVATNKLVEEEVEELVET